MGTAVGSGGTVQSLGYGTTFSQPSDGDSRAASTVLPAFAALADRTAWLMLQTGKYRCANVVNYSLDGGLNTGPDWATQTTSGSALTWGTFTTGQMPWAVNDVVANDIIEVSLTTSLILPGTGASNSYFFLSLFASSIVSPGGSPTYTKLNAGGTICLAQSTSSVLPVSLTGLWNRTSVGNAGTVSFELQAASALTSQAIGLLGDYNFGARIWRPTGLPQ